MSSKNKKVIERILARKSGAKDDYKIGLIIEGGGMRGCFSGGAMVALERLGLTNCFDYIYTSSAGSCAGAYFLSGQAALGASIYYENLTGFRFIRPWKPFSIMNVDYLIEDDFKKQKKLKINKIRNNPSTLKIFVSDADTGKSTFFTNHEKVDLFNVIKASCSLPIYYNKPVLIKGEKHLDGRVGKSLPIEEALTDGCTDLLVVTNVPEEYREPISFHFWGLLRRIGLPKELKEKYKNKAYEYNESLDIIFGRKKIHRKINICTISPAWIIVKIEMRKNYLKKMAEHGLYRTKEAFLLEEI